jgi:predicted CoA-substrate-specific enzyme activase
MEKSMARSVVAGLHRTGLDRPRAGGYTHPAMGREFYLGLDVGSVSTNLALLGGAGEVVETRYRYTGGDPIGATRALLVEALGERSDDVRGVGVTGSGRNLIGSVVGADVRRTEIIAHFRGAIEQHPGCGTIIEIGGQDSKLIVVRDGMVADFAMNSICAAGTGAFLDSQARRLGLDVRAVGALALGAARAAPISGRCTVFAESDMIHRQQQGFGQAEILAGLCRSLVKNYLNNCAKGKPIRPEILFQGGVSNNAGIVRAFEEELGLPVTVPEHNDVMGALGMALIAREAAAGDRPTAFKGLRAIAAAIFETTSFGCEHCDNRCDIVRVTENGEPIAYWGGACERWTKAAGG